MAIRGLDSQHNQPIVIGSKISFSNGEVYSYNDKKISEAINDLEPLAMDIELKKEKVFEEYDADFAICQYDKEKRKFFLARDLFGVKPLFYTWIDKDTLAFCSEIKGLKTFKNKKLTYNRNTILDYLIFGYPIKCKTFYKEINVFPQSTIFEWDLNKNMRKKYSSCLLRKLDIKESQEKREQDIYEPLKKAIKSRLQSDRNLGIHLSGGLDSSLIAEIIKPQLKEKINAYTVFRKSDDNDLIFSRKVASNNFKHIEIKMPNRENIEKVMKILDSPIMSSGAFVPYRIPKIAKKNKDIVLLEGQGADELFLGYSRFKSISNKMSNEGLIELLANSDIQVLQNLFPNRDIKKMIYNTYKSIIDSKDKNNYEKVQKFYIENFLAELLIIEDHMHMNESIENRVPYLSLPILKWIKKNDIFFNKNINKEVVLNTHVKLDSVVKERVIKQNMNGNLNIELGKRKAEFVQLLEYKIFEGMDYEKLEEYIYKIPELSKKEIFTLWTLYNIFIWYKINGFKEKIKI